MSCAEAVRDLHRPTAHRRHHDFTERNDCGTRDLFSVEEAAAP